MRQVPDLMANAGQGLITAAPRSTQAKTGSTHAGAQRRLVRRSLGRGPAAFRCCHESSEVGCGVPALV